MEQTVRILQQSWLRGQPPALCAEAAELARPVSLADGALLFARGDRGDGVYTVVSGAVRFSRATREGSASIISVLEPVAWFGELSCFDGLPRTHDAHALGATQLLHHTSADFERLLAAHPQLYAAFARLLSLRMRQTYDWLEEAAVLPFPARLARRLLTLAQAADDGEPRLTMTQEQLGQLLGRTRQSIARQLAQWESAGLIRLEYGGLRLRDPQALSRLAQLGAQSCAGGRRERREEELGKT